MEFSEASKVLGRNLDPSAPLSNSDLLQLFMKYTSSTVDTRVDELKEHLQESMSDDRKHFNEVLQVAIRGLCKKVESNEELIGRSISEINKVLSNIVLKFETIDSYQEEQINSMFLIIHIKSTYI